MAANKNTLKYVLMLLVGIGIGVPGGFVLNDYVERENPDEMRERCQDLQTQDQLENLFEGLQQRQGQ